MARWAWDAGKAAANERKHGVSFELAERVFGDLWHLTRPDDDPHEVRWRTLGMPSTDSFIVLMVIHTEPNDEGGVGRIISARHATRQERRDYEEGQF